MTTNAPLMPPLPPAGKPLSTAVQWDTLIPGLADPVHDSQAVFRLLLDALARPARLYTLALQLDTGATGAPSAALAALYTLADFATPLWLASANPALASALRFHTGATLAQTPAQAVFAWFEQPPAPADLAQFAQGTAEAPETSATLLIRVESLVDGPTLLCRGPGIAHTASFAPRGLPPGFWQARAALAADLPCGLDLYLICGASLAGVPRTTRVEEVPCT